MKNNELTIPVYAIGGIGLDDIPALMETGPRHCGFGFNYNQKQEKTIKQLKNDLYGTIIV
jgi:thiamine-phosphate pyrophosphorylase